jgi:regulator of protease activity HflC (stomatin/prohibitin superfamily)
MNSNNEGSLWGVLTGVGFIVALVIGALLLIMSLTIVGATERGVVTLFGKVQGTVEPGMHFLNPFASVHTYNVQTQKETTEASAASKDLQDVSTEIALNYNINPEGVVGLYLAVGDDVSSRIIDPSLQESIKAATAKYTAEELITKRAVVTDEILTNVRIGVTERLKGDYITVDAIAVTNFSFSESFNTAIESKVTAEQNALAQKNKLEQVKYEAQQTIEQAKAQAEAIRIQAQAVTSQGGADYVQLQAIKQWDGKLPTQMVPGSAVPFLNLTK